MSPNPCRLCLEESRTRIDIFSDNCFKDKLQLKIHLLFRFIINATDQHKLVCIDCVEQINNFYDYYIRVKRSQVELQIEKEFPDSDEDASDYAEHMSQILLANQELKNEYAALSKIHKDILADSPEESMDCADFTTDNLKTSSFKPVKSTIYHKKSENKDLKSAVNDQSDKSSEQNTSKNKLLNVKIIMKKRKPPPIIRKVQQVDTKFVRRIVSLSEEKTVDDFLKVGDFPEFPAVDTSLFPTEIMKDGMWIISRRTLDTVSSQFYNLQCRFCPVKPKFDKINSFQYHMRNFHEARGYLYCHYCGKFLCTYNSIINHMVKHIQPSACHCPVCNKEINPTSLKEHMQSHLPENEKLLRCKPCNKSFNQVASLRYHEAYHHTNTDDNLYICQICGLNCRKNVVLKVHMKSHKPKSILCQICGKAYLFKSKLLSHMNTHNDEPAMCNYCGLTCKNSLLLAKHIKGQHTAPLRRCDECNYSTREMGRLKRHIRRIHMEGAMFSCSTCGHRTKTKDALYSHIICHSKQDRYSCGYCPMKFKSYHKRLSHYTEDHPERYKLILREKQRRSEYANKPVSEVKNVQKIPEDEHQKAREYLNNLSNVKKQNSRSNVDIETFEDEQT